MKAVSFAVPGGPEVLRHGDLPDPVPTPLQVVVRVHACGVCGHDSADRAGLTRVPLPAVLGHEIAGEVVEVGADVAGFAVGDRVACKQFATCTRCPACAAGDEFSCPDKAFVYGGGAEYVALDQDTLLAVPDGVTSADAAITACAIGTCLQALDDVAGVRAGETVVVTGAGGGLGLHAMQVAAALGARVVAVTSSPAKAPLLAAHGADDVVVTTDGDLAARLTDLTDGRGPQVVLDNVGHPDLFGGCFRALAPRGRYVFTGQLQRTRISLHPAFVFGKEAVITGSSSTRAATFARAMDLVADGRVRPVHDTFPLTDAARAHRAVDERRVVGRAVLVP
ncbi:alcohol dehydrogenase catalytic domain-containing protein [Pseudonocardia sulfidoxydans]|uniref:alcohol dehydrogenase catalytic domain-containing protein n=1 Tax=Pseudonocardia sulfidoxydans TaxID=54011 RepID=UPI001649E642|nr:zinc-binding dehydrogenase [Pseudonocardia sulfidoxydans]